MAERTDADSKQTLTDILQSKIVADGINKIVDKTLKLQTNLELGFVLMQRSSDNNSVIIPFSQVNPMTTSLSEEDWKRIDGLKGEGYRTILSVHSHPPLSDLVRYDANTFLPSDKDLAFSRTLGDAVSIIVVPKKDKYTLILFQETKMCTWKSEKELKGYGNDLPQKPTYQDIIDLLGSYGYKTEFVEYDRKKGFSAIGEKIVNSFDLHLNK